MGRLHKMPLMAPAMAEGQPAVAGTAGTAGTAGLTALLFGAAGCCTLIVGRDEPWPARQHKCRSSCLWRCKFMLGHKPGLPGPCPANSSQCYCLHRCSL
jgi:hypothetical protein